MLNEHAGQHDENPVGDKPAEATNKEVPNTQAVSVEAQSFVWQGPVPDPVTLKVLADIYPDAPRIIFENFETEGKHRRDLEWFNTRRDHERRMAGMFLAFTLVASAIVAGAMIALVGDEPWAGSTLGGAGFLGLVVWTLTTLRKWFGSNGSNGN